MKRVMGSTERREHVAVLAQGGRQPLAGRLWRRTRFGDDCWEWTGCRNPEGYGRIGLGSHRLGIGYTHRLSWELMRGEIPKGMLVLHKCDNPPCIRPEHLFLGTTSDNIADCHDKGRSTMHAFSNAEATAIREDRASGRFTLRQLGDKYGVTLSCIHLIVTGKAYRRARGVVQ